MNWDWTAPWGAIAGRSHGHRAIVKVSLAFLVIAAYTASTGPAAHGACVNDQFRVGPSAHLPDCRAYELVTPAQLNGIPQAGMGNGADAARFTTLPVLPDGSRYIWESTAAGIPGTESSGFANLYAAERTEAGWVSSRLSPAAAQSEASEPGSFSRDQQYNLFLVESRRGGSLTFPTCGGCQILYLRHPDGSFHLLGEGTVPTGSDSDGFENGFVDDPYPSARWIAPGGGHQLFESLVQLTPETPTSKLPRVYDRTPSGLKLVSILPDESVPDSAAFAGSSIDGATVLFTAGGNLYARLDNASTVELASGSGGAVITGGVSADGSRAFFVQAGNISYYDFGSEEVEPVATPGDATLVQVSPDGSHAYFLSETELVSGKGILGAPNLYVWDGNSIGFIGTVSSEDLSRNGFPAYGLALWTPGIETRTAATNAARLLNTARTTPDGSVFVFESRAQLTAYPTEGHIAIYLYNDASEDIVCVSCNPDQPSPSGDSELAPALAETGGLQMNLHLDAPNLSSDGRQVVFESRGALLPGDVNGAEDVYEWRDGTISLISTGHAVQPSEIFGVTPSGNDIFFETGERLVGKGQETGALAIYDARVGGGLAPQQSTQTLACVGEACQGQPSAPPPLPSLGSATFAGPGNLKPKRCRHHRRKHRHHRSRSHKRQTSKSACGRKHRRAGK
ncbi:MAG TPA: hypothetical protein VEP91_01250 [Solirubrobacterales bacterium]|nr:hypothetical protein [Solirubrobacterales bacterium]